MVNYCIGNVGGLRRSFRSAIGEGVVSLDNEDVVADFKLSGKVFFVLGELPCSNMTVGEYVSYSRALKTQLPLKPRGCKALLKKAGLRMSLNAKISKLGRVNYRKAMLAARIDSDTRNVYVNFDGIPYSPLAASRVKKLLKSWGKRWEVFAGFSDYRFVPKKVTPTVYLPEGEAKGKVKQRSDKVGKFLFKRALKAAGLEFKWAGAQTIVKSDN